MHEDKNNVVFSDKNFTIDEEISQLTKLRTEPTENMRRATYPRQKLPIPIVRMLSGREAMGRFALADCSYALGRYLPANGPWFIDSMDSRAYVSQFSDDGSLLVAGFQGSDIRVYDVENHWKVLKNIAAKSLHWTITDTSLSPNKRLLAYASMSAIVHIVDLGSAMKESYANVTEIHDGLDFSAVGEDDEFGLFSIEFSSNGRELVAGSSCHSIHIYDLEANRLKTCFQAHADDVNTVTFADETGNIIYSGGDDGICKIWDMRCSTSDSKAAGALSGHIEGITYIDSRGDGRYFISNGKDQTTKMWDVRRMSSKPEYFRRRGPHWDYRYMAYPSRANKSRHPRDQSVATYRGHAVLCTLIRCHFSPVHNTGQKYIYSGSHDGCVYIYEVITGAQVAKLEFGSSTVRDCSWHASYPILVSSSWDGIVGRWEFPGTDSQPILPKRRRRHR
ncbi:LEC14B homolog [Phalaenopsis equestris]|uniref:LEC14B homolog n=1 Tax=Phalaenopsis equestris TaxID=78828 RepID=UPI0009E31B4B|nr:LEC14B homolog [Phalaenopsis equestris]